ncbi:hypothetical protein [Pseudomonas monsensis]
MLNDFAKELMKPWFSVQNFVWVLAVIFGIALLKPTSSELAGWVQAIGSIAAILGALKVGRLQIENQNAVVAEQVRNQDEAKNKELRARAGAMFAVVQCCANQAEALANIAKQKMPVEILKMTWEAHLKELSLANLNALKGIPTFELGSYDLVVTHSHILASFISLISEIERVVVGDRAFHAPESNEIYAGVIQHNGVLQYGFRIFTKSHEERLASFS